MYIQISALSLMYHFLAAAVTPHHDSLGNVKLFIFGCGVCFFIKSDVSGMLMHLSETSAFFSRRRDVVLKNISINIIII